MGRSVLFSVVVAGLVGLLAWKSHHATSLTAGERIRSGRSTASEPAPPAPATPPKEIQRAGYVQDSSDESDDSSLRLKTKTSLVIEPLTPEEQKKVRRADAPAKLTGVEEVQ